MADVEKKENKIIEQLHLTGREQLKQTIKALESTGYLNLTYKELQNTINLMNKKKRTKKKKEEIICTTDEQRQVKCYYDRLQMLFFKAHKRYLEHVRDFDRVSLKSANLMEEVITDETQEKLKMAKNKIDLIYKTTIKDSELLSNEYSDTIKKDLNVVKEVIESLITSNNELLEEKNKFAEYEKTLVGTTLMLSFALENVAKVEAIVKIFEAICKKHKLNNKFKDTTKTISSYYEVLLRVNNYSEIMKKHIAETEKNKEYIEQKLMLDTKNSVSNKALQSVIEAYIYRKDKLYDNYKTLNKVAQARIEKYLNYETKTWRDDFNTIDLEQYLIDDLISLYESEMGVF